VEALRKLRFGMDCRVKPGNDERNGKERTKEKIRRRNADRRKCDYAVPTGTAAPQA
jgi:acetylornithine deacetylase/succinyl-diaminopimelate desuccinylase-like protein